MVHSTGLDFITVSPGDPVTASIWNRMVAANRARRILGGVGTTTTVLPHGTIISAETPKGFSHPWYVSASSRAAIVRPGLVNGGEATINDRKLSDPNTPVLLLEDGKYDDNGYGWIALELRLNATQSGPGAPFSVLNTYKYLKVVQCANIENDHTAAITIPQFQQGITGLSDYRARYPLARLISRSGGIEVFQIAYFNLNHKAKTVRANFFRHFFWPA